MKNDKRRITEKGRIHTYLCVASTANKDKRRIDSKERAHNYLCEQFGMHNDSTHAFNSLVKMLGDHVKAAHKRHARKNVCITKNGLDKETIIGLKTRFNARA